MTSWTVHCLECSDVAAREALMRRFEREHPVTFPDDRYSVVAEFESANGPVEADFAWVGRYLYVTTTEPAGGPARAAMDDWERAVVGEFDATANAAEQVTLILDPDAGGDDEVAGGRFQGLEDLGGMDVLYALAMRNQFRFRSYSAVPPARHTAPHPDAFTVVDAVEEFVADMAEATGVEPTEAGRAFLRDDPADDDRYVFGETYGPDGGSFAGSSRPLGEEAVPAGGELPAEVRDDADLPGPREVLDDEHPGRERGIMARLRRLFGR